eukprot:5197721-Alexandrium_andersonii.AAC.1
MASSSTAGSRPRPGANAPHPWEAPDYDDGSSDSSEDDPIEVAAHNFACELLDLYLAGTLSAKS